MQNPFESGHIKNYLLLYASVVVIVILFFIASRLFHDVKEVKKKEFNTTIEEVKVKKESLPKKSEESKPKLKLLEKAY